MVTFGDVSFYVVILANLVSRILINLWLFTTLLTSAKLEAVIKKKTESTSMLFYSSVSS